MQEELQIWALMDRRDGKKNGRKNGKKERQLAPSYSRSGYSRNSEAIGEYGTHSATRLVTTRKKIFRSFTFAFESKSMNSIYHFFLD